MFRNTRMITGTSSFFSAFLGVFVAMMLSASIALADAPFGDKVGQEVVNYNRAAPNVATSGIVKNDGYQRLKALGFTDIVELKTPQEGIEKYEKRAQGAGLSYHKLPVTRDLPSDQQVRELEKILKNAKGAVLISCASGNRASTLFTLHRIKNEGWPVEIAIEDGKGNGMKDSRAEQIRKNLK